MNKRRAVLPGGRRQHGAALVEYAFVVIIFFSLIFGITGFGHALYVYHAINNAAKEGTRWAAVNGATCGNSSGGIIGDNTCDGTNGMNNGPASRGQIETYVKNSLPASVQVSNAYVHADFLPPASGLPALCTNPVTPPGGTTIPATENYPGCTVSVTISYAYVFYFPLVPVTNTTTAPCTVAGYCMTVTSEMIIAH